MIDIIHLSSSKDTSLKRVLELACQKRKIPQPYNDYALLLVLSTAPPARVGHAGDFTATIAAPLNKTIAMLPHALEGLALVPRSGADLLGESTSRIHKCYKVQ